MNQTGLLNVKPSSGELEFLLESGYLLKDLGRYAEARDVFLGVAALLPDQPLPQTALGSCLLAEGRVDEAFRHLQAVRERFPDDPMVMVQIAEVLIWKKDLAGAKTLLQQALEKDPRGPAAGAARSWLKAAGQLE